MSEPSTHHAARWAGLLFGAALLLALAAWLCAPRRGGALPAAASAPRGSGAGAGSAEITAPVLEAPAPATRAAEPSPMPAAARTPPPPVVAPGPSERELYELYLVQLARDPDALAREAAGALRGEGPRNRRVALLRAAWDLGLPGAPQLFQQALRAPADDADRHAASLADFALRFLARRGAREPLAWTTLFDALHLGATGMEPRLRASAAIRLVESASPSDLSLLVALAQEDRQGDVAQSLVGALRTRTDEAARAALRALGADDAPLAPSLEEEASPVSTDGRR